MNGTILKGLNELIKIQLGEHLIPVPTDCEGVLPPDHDIQFRTLYAPYKACSEKDRTFAIKTLLLILQHFKHCPLQSNPLYWRYTVPNVSSIVGMLPGTRFL